MLRMMHRQFALAGDSFCKLRSKYSKPMEIQLQLYAACYMQPFSPFLSSCNVKGLGASACAESSYATASSWWLATFAVVELRAIPEDLAV